MREAERDRRVDLLRTSIEICRLVQEKVKEAAEKVRKEREQKKEK